MGDTFIPRISVSDDEDATTVAAALAEYVHAVAHRGMTSGEFRIMVEEVGRAARLLDCLITEVEDRAIAGMFGSEEEFRQRVEKLVDDHDENPEP